MQRAQPDRPLAARRLVAERQREHELVGHEVVAVQLGPVRARRVLVLLGDRDVEAAAREHRQRVLGLELDQLDAQLRVGVRQPRERRHHQRARRGLERGDAHDARHRPRLPREVGLEPLELGQHVAGPRGEHPPGVGQLEPAAALAEQLDARLALELRELLRHGGGREGERLRGARDRPLGDELAQHEQTAGSEHR